MGLLDKKNINNIEENEYDPYKVAFEAQLHLGDYRNLFKNCTKIWSFEDANTGEAIYVGKKAE